MFASFPLKVIARPVMILALVLVGFGLFAPAASASKHGGLRPPDLVVASHSAGQDQTSWYMEVIVKNQSGNAGGFYANNFGSNQWVPGHGAGASVVPHFSRPFCPPPVCGL